MRARKNFSYLALLSLQSAPIPRKGKRPSLNLGDDTNFFAQFECAPLSSIIRRGVQHTYRINVQCSSDTIKIAEELLKELAERIRAHIVAKPFPTDNENEQLFSSIDGRIAVSLRHSDFEGHGYVVTSTSANAGQSPQAYFRRIVKRLSNDKALQVANYRPSVVVIELANDSSGIANLGASDTLWEVYGPLFRLEEIPSTVDLVILTWQDIYGKTWGHARALRNPSSTWAQSSEAESIYRLIAA
jgi:hypothetical protein